MDQIKKLTLDVRRVAGHDAIRIVRDQGLDVGGEMLAEAFLTYLRAFAAVKGWDEALHRVYVQARIDRAVVHAPVRKLEIAVSNTAEIVSRQTA